MEHLNYYSLTTKKFVLRCKHMDWLGKTQGLYNEVLKFYYDLFLERRELQSLHSHQAARSLEVLTIIGRDKQSVPYPLPFVKLPLYFRRAALNAAIAAGKSYLSVSGMKKPAEQFHQLVTFYKGTYRDFTEKAITLKVWNGEAWKWVKCGLTGNYLPEEAECLSPSVGIKGKNAILTVPVREEVKDGRKAKERMKEKLNICVLQFTNRDALAVCLVMNEKGQKQKIFFLRGGAKYAHSCRLLVKKIEKSEASSGNQKVNQPNKKYWVKLKNISDYFSNTISRQIINICTNNNVSIIVLPKYSEQYMKIVMASAQNLSPLHLTYRIRNQLAYKAWREGILILEVDASYTSSVCAKCGASVHREQEMVICTNGHKGNRVLNTAYNLGHKCLKSFGKQVS